MQPLVADVCRMWPEVAYSFKYSISLGKRINMAISDIILGDLNHGFP